MRIILKWRGRPEGRAARCGESVSDSSVLVRLASIINSNRTNWQPGLPIPTPTLPTRFLGARGARVGPGNEALRMASLLLAEDQLEELTAVLDGIAGGAAPGNITAGKLRSLASSAHRAASRLQAFEDKQYLSLIHISEPTRP